MMETDIASEELVKQEFVKQFLLPEQSLLPSGVGDVFGASPTPDLVENLSDSIHQVTSGSLEGIDDTLESPETCSPDILDISTSQVDLESPVGLTDSIIDHQAVNQTCITNAGINLNQPIYILNNQLPTAWAGTSLLTSERGLYIIVDKGAQQTITLPFAATATQINTTQTGTVQNLLINSTAFNVIPGVTESTEIADEDEDFKEEDNDDDDEPTQPFDYSIFLNKLPPKIEIEATQSTNNSSIVFQVMGEDGEVQNVINRAELETSEEKTVTPTAVVSDQVKSASSENRIFKCDLCTATFNRKGNFTRHRLVHTVNSKEAFRYKCDKCSRQFLQKCDLTRHMHIHNRTEPHRCSVCDKGYIRMKDLVVHMKFHSQEKNFRCPHCEKKFYQIGDLKRHMRRIHEKSKGLTCGHCQKKYAKESTLIRHMQTRHRDIILQSLDQISGKKGDTGQESGTSSSTEGQDEGGNVSVVEMSAL